MRHQIIALLLLVQLAVALAVVLRAQAAGKGSLSGRVFIDANGNGMVEPGEAVVPLARVSVVAQADASHRYEVTADAEGLFVLTSVDYGLYDVSAGATGRTIAQAVTQNAVCKRTGAVLPPLRLKTQEPRRPVGFLRIG